MWSCIYSILTDTFLGFLYSSLILFVVFLYFRSDYFNDHLRLLLTNYESKKISQRSDSEMLLPFEHINITQSEHPSSIPCIVVFDDKTLQMNVKIENQHLYLRHQLTTTIIPLTNSLQLSIHRKNYLKSQTTTFFDYKNHISNSEKLYIKYKQLLQQSKSDNPKADALSKFTLEEMRAINRFKRQKFKRYNSAVIRNIPLSLHCGNYLKFKFADSTRLEQFYIAAKRSISGKNTKIVDDHFAKLSNRLIEKSNVLDPQLRHFFCGFNFLVHRVFYQFFDNARLAGKIKEKLTEKIDYASLPSVVKSLKVVKVSLGPNFPIFSSPKLHTSRESGKQIVDVYGHYTDGITMIFEGILQLPLKKETTNVTATFHSKNVQGNLKLMFLPIPCSGMFIGLNEEPELELISDIRLSEKEKKDENGGKMISKVITYFVKKELLTNAFIVPSMQRLPIQKGNKEKKHTVLSLQNSQEALDQHKRIKKMFKQLPKKDTPDRRESPPQFENF
ncbi:SMP-LTD domain-containing protein [Entamoeba marina]